MENYNFEGDLETQHTHKHTHTLNGPNLTLIPLFYYNIYLTFITYYITNSLKKFQMENSLSPKVFQNVNPRMEI